MQGTTSRLRTDPASRLAGLRRDRPEWTTWLALLSELRGALGDAGSRDLVTLIPAGTTGVTQGAPLLQSYTLLELDTGWLQQLVHRLAAAANHGTSGAQPLGPYRPDRGEVVRLLSAVTREDRDDLAAIAAKAGVEPGPLASIAYLAAIPVLANCARLLQSQLPHAWSQGYCPLCGAWPVLAEQRGLDRTRWLRCGRCTGAWEVEPLWCSYCGERDHRKLGSLVLDGAGDTLKVDTCESCRGYLKSIATLQAIPPFELLLQDLETVELDLVALERGYERRETKFKLSSVLREDPSLRSG
jgi:FdhE protein